MPSYDNRLVIDPPAGAVENYLWVYAQKNIVDALQALSDAQAAINPDYGFVVVKNKFLPQIEDLVENNHLVNVLVGNIETNNDSDVSKNHEVTFNIDMYVQGDHEIYGQSLVPADDAAVQRLQYLMAMVEYSLTDLANFYHGLNSGQIQPGSLQARFQPVPESEESSLQYAPATIEFKCRFPYSVGDIAPPPALEGVKSEFSNWLNS